MDEAGLKAIEDAYAGGIGTHWVGCHLKHPKCAMFLLLAEVRRLRAEAAASALREIANAGEWQSLGDWLQANGHFEVAGYLAGHARPGA